MQIASPLSVVAPTSPPRAGPGDAPEGGESFASLLTQQAAPEADAPLDTAAPAPVRAKTPPARSANRGAEHRAERARPSAGAAGTVDAPEAPRPDDAQAVLHAEDDAADTDDALHDPGLADWRAALHLPAPQTPAPSAACAAGTANGTPDPAGGPGDARPDASAGMATLARFAGWPGNGVAPADDGAQASAGAVTRALATNDTAAPGSLAHAAARGSDKAGSFARRLAAAEPAGQAAEAARAAAATPQARAEEPTSHGASVQGAQASTPLRSTAADPVAWLQPSAAPAVDNAPAASTAPLPVPLNVPLEDPQFARAFGVQVSVLARDGVQQAELHLNPAEMGPVSIQIMMDGTQARIDFGVDVAATRDAIEHSLPELAAALREAGLTLSGGGVSQQSAGRGNTAHRHDELPHGGRRTGVGAAVETAQPTMRRIVPAGGVDLYA